MALFQNGRPHRPCSHSGCMEPAVATLSFDYAASRAWLHDLPDPPDPASYDLCSGHAARFRPPRGWDVEDHRRADLEGAAEGIEEEIFQADVTL